MSVLTPEILLNAYTHGIFPMAETRDDPEIFWVDPERRGIFPLEQFRVSKSLRKKIKQNKFKITVDTCFRQVMKECAAPSEGRENTWINRTILDLYTELHLNGNAHPIEVWREDQLVGGLYGVSFASVFCGESMFSKEADASKIALTALVSRLKHGGFQLLDTQFLTEHLASLGAVEISREEYHRRLDQASTSKSDFYSLGLDCSSEEILQSITQTS